MLKVMIVEDDIFDYTHLKNLIDWNKNGFQISEQIKNVDKAVEKLKAEGYDILITDMKMPGKSGADLIQYTAEKFPEIKSIALSGYRDFNYVKKSLKAGAEDYILKHELKQQNLLKILSRIEKELKENKEVSESEMFEESFFLDQKEILIQNFVEKLLRGHFNSRSDLKKQLELLSVNFKLQNIVTVVGQFDDYSLLEEKYSPSKLMNVKRSFINMTDEILKEHGNSFAVLKDEKNFLFLFSFENNSELQINNSIASALNRIKTALKNYLNITASFAVGKILRNPLDIEKDYLKTVELLKNKFYQGKDVIIYQNQNNKVENNDFSLDIKREKTIQKYINRKNEAELKIELDEIFADILEKKPGLSAVKMTLISLINIINSNIKNNSLNQNKIFKNNENPYQKLENLNTLAEFKSWIKKSYTNLIKELEDNNNYSKIIREALAYLEKNYDRNITLSQTADKIGVSYSYLSRKFKKECGRGFSDYLNRLRIREAKKLISEKNTNIKEIVNLVGFNNYNYFFKVFKDIEGITPSEYESKNI